jgi:glycosyltransferase involved in cell wall biosynthesis
MEHPLISVIIPVYKVEKYIRECLESVLAQTLREIEIIVVNDGSPDRSAEIVREYVSADSRIKFIEQPNGGLSAARNTGMRAASAPLVMFIDSDDYVSPDYCRKMFDALTADADAAVCWTRLFYEDATPSPPYKKTAWYRFDADDIKRCNSLVTNKLFRMNIIRGHGIEFPAGLKNEDEFFWHAYLPRCRKMPVVREELYHYRQRKDGIMGTMHAGKEAVRSDILRILAALGDHYDQHGLLQSDEWAGHYWRVFDNLLRASQKYRPKRFKPKKRGLSGKIERFFKS